MPTTDCARRIVALRDSGAIVTYTRDAHGTLRPADSTAGAVPWPSSRPAWIARATDPTATMHPRGRLDPRPA